jgi:hypothetical protein
MSRRDYEVLRTGGIHRGEQGGIDGYKFEQTRIVAAFLEDVCVVPIL